MWPASIAPSHIQGRKSGIEEYLGLEQSLKVCGRRDSYAQSGSQDKAKSTGWKLEGTRQLKLNKTSHTEPSRIKWAACKAGGKALPTTEGWVIVSHLLGVLGRASALTW